MVTRVLVVDDEALARQRLVDMLAELEPQAIVGEAGDAAAALVRLDQEPWDVALLDVQMPGLDGLRLAALLRQKPSAPALVFVTAHAEHAIQAFELDAVDYLTKPVRLQRLRQALDKARRWRAHAGSAETAARGGAAAPSSPPALIIHERGRTERVWLDDVVYLKAELKYVTVRTPQRSYIYDGALHEFERTQPQRWLRVHRNALVARQRLRALERVHERSASPQGEAFDGWVVRLDGVPERLQVSRRQLAAVREALRGEGAVLASDA
ncbi:Transcriptional regulatory protein YpdB [Tepidimonas alkaliphilus]|uniref:Transcriptional regulatory protein YpdB n=1 Tax=Tepidimonas alkaliphilus TaxID=2588942 RepID=A0A554WCU2_9BURK|nr:LytTR family DNA-binding domain-containing protein [Tepidimonas alkaliphilus]TSE21402.1 Transcriptional regulatory protein YpdB [Tepidimonas alkaliphilus]